VSRRRSAKDPEEGWVVAGSGELEKSKAVEGKERMAD